IVAELVRRALLTSDPATVCRRCEFARSGNARLAFRAVRVRLTLVYTPAFAVRKHVDSRGVCAALVAVRVPVASADRIVLLRAEFRAWRADAEVVRGTAQGLVRVIAELVVVAREPR